MDVQKINKKELELKACFEELITKQERLKSILEDVTALRKQVKELNQEAGDLMTVLKIEEYSINGVDYARRTGVAVVKLKRKRSEDE